MEVSDVRLWWNGLTLDERAESIANLKVSRNMDGGELAYYWGEFDDNTFFDEDFDDLNEYQLSDVYDAYWEGDG